MTEHIAQNIGVLYEFSYPSNVLATGLLVDSSGRQLRIMIGLCLSSNVSIEKSAIFLRLLQNAAFTYDQVLQQCKISSLFFGATSVKSDCSVKEPPSMAQNGTKSLIGDTRDQVKALGELTSPNCRMWISKSAIRFATYPCKRRKVLVLKVCGNLCQCLTDTNSQLDCSERVSGPRTVRSRPSSIWV